MAISLSPFDGPYAASDDQFSGLDALLGTRKKKKQRTPAISAEEEDSLLRSIYHAGTSGLTHVANVLDTPGAAVRDTLSNLLGRKTNIASNVLNPEDRTTGWDLLEHVGFGKNREGFHPISDPLDALRDVAALGTEIGLDPAAYMTLGASALTKGGKLLKRAGQLGDVAQHAGVATGKRTARLTTVAKDVVDNLRAGETAADVAKRRTAIDDAAKGMGMGPLDVQHALDQPVGAAASFMGMPIGTGPTAVKYAKKLDALGSAIHWAKIPGTEIRPIAALHNLFDAKTHAADDIVGQHIMKNIIEPGEVAAGAVARGKSAEVARRIHEAGPKWNALTEEVSDEMRAGIEGVRPVAPELRPVVDYVRQTLDPMVKDANEWGSKLSEMVDDVVKFFPRGLTQRVKKLVGRKSGKSGLIVDASDPHAIQRELAFKNIQGGTVNIKEMAKDMAALRGSEELADRIAADPILANIDAAAKAMAAKGTPLEEKHLAQMLIDRKYHADIPDFYEIPDPLDPKKKIKVNQRDEVKSYLASAELPVLESGIHGNHVALDYARRTMNHEQALASSKGILTAFADDRILDHARKMTFTPGEHVELGKLLDDLKFDVPTALNKLGELKKIIDPNEIEALAKVQVPKDLAKSLTRYVEAFKGPKAVGDLVKAYDAVANVFKVGVTSPWPAFHARNFLSGQFQNWLHGQFSFQSFKQAKDIADGKEAHLLDIPVIQRMLTDKGLAHNDKNATDMLRLLDFEHGYTSQGKGLATDVIEHGEVPGKQFEGLKGSFAGGLGGENPKTLGGAFGKLKGGTDESTWNPKNAKLRGVGGAPESTFAPLATGEAIGQWTETVNHLAPAIELLRKGHSPAEVKKMVDLAQISYSRRNFTPFENEAMKRLFPFYSFTKGVIPRTIEELIQHPGGRTAQTIRATNRGRNPGELTPDYVAESAAIPLGEQADGSQRYLTGFGFQHEDPLSFMGGGVKGAFLEGLSRTNPLAKVIPEWASGQTFFQKGPIGGRPLEDLDPTMGRILSNLLGKEKAVKLPPSLEYIAGNSPASRALTTLRTATDKRKWNLGGLANAATGFRITDISPAARDALERERVGRLMKDMGGKQFTKSYIPEEELLAMTPEERVKALQAQAVMNVLAERAKARKEAKGEPRKKKKQRTLASLLQ